LRRFGPLFSAVCTVSVVVVSGLRRFGFVVFSDLRRFGRLFSAACAVSVVVFSSLRCFGSACAFVVLRRFLWLSPLSPLRTEVTSCDL